MERNISFALQSILRSFVLRGRQWSTEFFLQGRDPGKKMSSWILSALKSTPPFFRTAPETGSTFPLLCRYLRFLAYIVPAYVSYCNDFMFNVILLLLCVFLLKRVSFMLTFVKVPTLRRFLMTASGKLLNLYTW